MTWQGHVTKNGGRFVARLGNFALQQQGGVEREGITVACARGSSRGCEAGINQPVLCTSLFISFVIPRYDVFRGENLK